MSTEHEQTELLDVDEIGATLWPDFNGTPRQRRRRVYALAENRELPVIRLGGRIYVRRKSLIERLEQLENGKVDDSADG